MTEIMLRERVYQEILSSYLADNLKTRILSRDGAYRRIWQSASSRRRERPPSGAAAFNAQEFLIGLAEGRQTLQDIPIRAPRARRRLLAGKER